MPGGMPQRPPDDRLARGLAALPLMFMFSPAALLSPLSPRRGAGPAALARTALSSASRVARRRLVSGYGSRGGGRGTQHGEGQGPKVEPPGRYIKTTHPGGGAVTRTVGASQLVPQEGRITHNSVRCPWRRPGTRPAWPSLPPALTDDPTRGSTVQRQPPLRAAGAPLRHPLVVSHARRATPPPCAPLEGRTRGARGGGGAPSLHPRALRHRKRARDPYGSANRLYFVQPLRAAPRCSTSPACCWEAG